MPIGPALPPPAPFSPAIPVPSVPAGQLTPNLTQTNIALTLGGFSFLQFEVPEEINDLGIVIKMAVHDFAGGYRTVQTLGSFPPQLIRWAGQFWYGDIPGEDMYTDRIGRLVQMAQAQQGYMLTTGPFIFNPVFIKRLELKERLGWWIPYSIELVPVQSQTTNQVAPPSPTPGQTIQSANNQSQQLGTSQSIYKGPILPGLPSGIS